MSVKKIAITGGAGQIAYSLIFRIANGDLLGPNQPVSLHLLDVPEGVASLKGVVMELEDCVFPLLKEVKIGSEPLEMFEGVDHAILVGSKPRGPGMERKDLLADNGKIFVGQGKALNKAASKDVQVIVVGNPCNTNCLIAMHHAPDLPRENFHSMMRLDQNRATYQLAHKAGVPIHEVTHVAVWGNHSSTQVPDYVHAKIRGLPAPQVIHDKKWLEETFVQTVQKRGAQVIAARGKSSAASAANAIIGSVRSFVNPTHAEQWFSAGVASEGNPYGIADGLVFSFPCLSKGHGEYEIISGLQIDSHLQQKIALTQKELIEERDLVAHLMR